MWSAAPILAAGTTTLSSGQRDEIWVAAVVSGVLAYAFAVYCRRVTGAYPWRVPALVWGLFGVLLPVISLLLVAVARLTTRPVRPPAAGPYGPGYFGTSSHDASSGSDPSVQGAGWPPPAGTPWEPPPPGQDQAPVSPGSWQPSPVQWQPPAAPQWQPPTPGQQTGSTGSSQQVGSEQVAPGPWQPGTPGTPAAPPWPPPLGPEAFQPQPGQGYPPTPPPYAGQAPQPGTTWQSSAGPAAAQPALPGPDGWAQPPPYVPAPTPPPLFGWYPDPTGRHEQRYWDGRHWSHRVSDNSVRFDDPLNPVAGPSDDSATEAAHVPEAEFEDTQPDDVLPDAVLPGDAQAEDAALREDSLPEDAAGDAPPTDTTGGATSAT